MLKEEYIKPETLIVLFDDSDVSIVTASPFDNDPDNAGIIIVNGNGQP